MKKTSSFISKNTLKLVPLLLGAAVLNALPGTATAAPLFYEDWSDLNNGQTAASSGRWSMVQGVDSQFVVVKDPTSFSGSWISPGYGETVVLPTLHTTESFQMSDGGIRLAANIVLTNTTNQYFRIGIESADNPSINYWFSLFRNQVGIEKRVGSAPRLDTHYFNSSEWGVNQEGLFALTIKPLEETGYQISLWKDDQLLLTVNDTENLPDFSNGFRIMIGARDAQQGYISNISLTHIPEGKTLSLIIPAVVIGLLMLRRFRNTP